MKTSRRFIDHRGVNAVTQDGKLYYRGVIREALTSIKEPVTHIDPAEYDETKILLLKIQASR